MPSPIVFSLPIDFIFYNIPKHAFEAGEISRKQWTSKLNFKRDHDTLS